MTTLVPKDGSLNNGTSMSQMLANHHISVPKLFADGDVSELLKQFNICSKANEWRDEMK